MHYKKGQDRSQWFTTCLEDYVEADSPVRELDSLVRAIIKEGNLSGESGNSNIGCRAYSIRDLLCLHLYGYINGITSSRQLERAARINKEVCWLLKDNRPTYKTIADFRKNNGVLIEKVFYLLVQRLSSENYITGKLVVLDGNKTKANAQRDMLSVEQLKKQIAFLDKDAHTYIQELETVDRRESESSRDNDRPDQPSSPISSEQETTRPKEETLLKKQKQLSEAEASGKNYYSPTDVDAVLVPTRRGKVAGYNR